MPRPEQILLTDPAYFDVQYVINPHMAGNIGDVDTERARTQWDALRAAYERIGQTVHVLPAQQGLLDMVFCANQTLPYWTRKGELGVFLSRMYAEQRQDEVPHYARFFEDLGYVVRSLPEGERKPFEGMGDAIWHPERALLWGGHGFRTDAGVYPHLAEWLEIPVCTLTLDDPDFYHLDTCLCVLDERTALLYPGAFDADGLAMLGRLFDRLLEAPEEEARSLFACNAHCPDGRHVLIQQGCTATNQLLRDAGYEPIELDTGEFLKSGGSVFCMKLAFW